MRKFHPAWRRQPACMPLYCFSEAFRCRCFDFRLHARRAASTIMLFSLVQQDVPATCPFCVAPAMAPTMSDPRRRRARSQTARSEHERDGAHTAQQEAMAMRSSARQ